ncbi:MAG: 2OG-Fe(II) oxygenase [Pseudomonadota bacterium]
MSFPPLEEQVSDVRAAAGTRVAARLAQTPGIVRVATDQADLFTLTNFLDPAGCATMIGLIEENCQPSSIFEAEGYGSDYRNSSSCNLLRWDPRVKLVDDAIADLLGLASEYGETVQGQRYEVGQQFRQHADFFFIDQPYWPEVEKNGGQRTWTAMVFLNEPEGGGATSFPKLGLNIAPERGKLLAWNNMRPNGAPNLMTMHEGTTVTAGRKYIVTKWFRERPWI